MKAHQTRSAAITAVGSYVPEEVLTNHDLEQMVDTTDEWIRSRTGIVDDEIMPKPKTPNQLSSDPSSENFSDKNNIDPATIDLVLFSHLNTRL